MAVTIAFAKDTEGRQRVGKQTVVTGRITPTGTYATGGFAVTAADFGLGSIESLRISGSAFNGTEFNIASWDSANSKIKLGWTGAVVSTELDEITNGDTCTGFVVDVEVKGRG